MLNVNEVITFTSKIKLGFSMSRWLISMRLHFMPNFTQYSEPSLQTMLHNDALLFKP